MILLLFLISLSFSLSKVELMYQKILNLKKPLKQFGYDIFECKVIPPNYTGNVPLNFSLNVSQIRNYCQVSEIKLATLGKDYILGPGDVLRIYFWGDPVDVLGFEIVSPSFNTSFTKRSTFYDFKVDLEGKIFIPKVGVFVVYGKTIKEFEDELRKRLSQKFKNFKVEVSLGKIRSFIVYVSGFVRRAGAVRVNALSTLLDALTKAGGVAKNGSLRRIKLIRGGKSYDIDLYKLLIYGKSVDVRLKEGDLIEVLPIGKTCAIYGGVKREGIYELKEGETLGDLIKFAGGFLPDYYQRSLRVLEIEKGSVVVKEVKGNYGKVPLKDGCVVFVGEYPLKAERFVFVEGYVKQVGFFSLEKTKTLKDLIEKVGLLPDTDKRFASLLRFEKGKYKVINFSPEEVLEGKFNLKLKPLDRVSFFKRWVFKPIQVGGLVKNPRAIPYHKGIRLREVIGRFSFLKKVEDLKVEVWRVNKVYSIDLYKLLVEGDESLNIPLKEGDKLVVKEKEKGEFIRKVVILGEVKRPGVYKFREGMTLYDLIKEAGGYTKEAYPRGLILIRNSAKKLQYQRLKIALMSIQEVMLSAPSKVSSVGGSAQEVSILQVLINAQKKQLDLLKKRALFGLGRIALDIPPTLEELKNSKDNIPLVEGDFVFVPRRPHYVLVLGEVYNQISLPYRKGYRVRDYLKEVGWITDSADMENLFVIKANGKIVSKKSASLYGISFEGGKVFLGKDLLDMELEEGDTIVVPIALKVPILWRPLIKDIVQIMFQAISTAVLAQRL